MKFEAELTAPPEKAGLSATVVEDEMAAFSQAAGQVGR